MGLPRAIKAHGEGDIVEAALHYERALEQQQFKPELFQNYGSLLKDQGKFNESEKIYQKGLSLFDENPHILLNYANLAALKGCKTQSLELSLRGIKKLRNMDSDGLEKAYCACIECLIDLGQLQWALSLWRLAVAEVGQSRQCLWLLFRINHLLESSSYTNDQRVQVLKLIELSIGDFAPIEQAEFFFTRSFYELQSGDIPLAMELSDKARLILQSNQIASTEERHKAQKLVDINAWNTSCLLLKLQDFRKGWRLFEYGLRTPSPGKQRWQRALPKLFSHRELPLWRGTDLSGQRLLLLEEQAIGDTMMFLSLIPALLDEVKHLGIVVSKRLLPIYKRSLRQDIDSGIVNLRTHSDLQSGSLRLEDFDLQCPLGSICQHRFVDVECYAPRTPMLRPDLSKVKLLRENYLGAKQSDKLIGVSWRGGGLAQRILEKSVPTSQFAEIMHNIHGVRFVSLQYGDVTSVIDEWKGKGLPVIHDHNINPLKDMDAWLDQVAACDAVISVANTTIHGAGGLNIPTLCLLSKNSDWRWFQDESILRSYWYPSVGIARQQNNGSWQGALIQAQRWLSMGCPMPEGSMHRDL